MKTKIILFILLILSANIKAQSNFKKGYIVTNRSDTINGWIDLRMDDKNAYRCVFKSEPEKQAITYSPGEISEFRFDEIGKYYVSRKITIDGEEREVFLEFLIKGEMNLYYYLQDNKEYFFFENQEGKMEAVTKKDDYVTFTENNVGQRGVYIKSDILYKQRLYNIFNNQAPVMQKNIEHADFNKRNMIELTKKYHNLTCTSGEACIQFENDYKRSFDDFNFTVYGGISHFTYIPKKINIDESFHFNNTTSFFPFLGIQAGIARQRLMKSISFQIGLTLSKLNLSDSYEKETQLTVYPRAIHTHTLKAWMLGSKLGLRYTYPKGSYRPFAEAGFSMIYLGNLSNVYSIDLMQDYSRSVEQNFFTGYYGGIGVNCRVNKKHIITASLSYEGVKAAFILNDKYKDKMRNVQFKVGYMF